MRRGAGLGLMLSVVKSRHPMSASRPLLLAASMCVGYDLDDVRAAGSFLDDQDDEPAFAL